MLEGFQRKNKDIKKDDITAEQCFDVLTDEEKTELLNNRMEIEFAAGETIIKQGFVASNIIFLEEGLAKLDILTDGKTTTVGLVAPKSFIGIICTFANHNVDFSSIALEKTSVSIFDIDLFEKFVKQNGEFACRIIKHMSLLTNNLVHQISRFSHKNIEGALSLILLDFSNIYKTDSIVLPVNRIELANMLGYSKESVINTLSKFNKEGILKVQDKQIEIIDKKKLLAIGKIG